MNAAEKIAHAAERKAFEAMLDSLIRKSQTKDVCTVANDFVNMDQKIHSSVRTPETYEILHQIDRDNLPEKKVLELEAEASSYVVCKAVGLETGTASSDCITSPWMVPMNRTAAASRSRSAASSPCVLPASSRRRSRAP